MNLRCRLVGHDLVSFSTPASIPFLPEIRRVAKRVCDRCGYTVYAINEL